MIGRINLPTYSRSNTCVTISTNLHFRILPQTQNRVRLCPLVKSWAHHPIERLRAEGVKVTVSTDDPPFFHTTMSHEYEKLADTFGWDEARFAEVNRAAIEAAFCDDATRARVLKRLET